MTPTLLTKIETRGQVRHHLDWHLEQRVPLRLMFGASEGHLPAYVVGFDDVAGTMDVVCMGAQGLQSRSTVSYAVIGSTASGARFLASGQMSASASEQHSFKLSFPQWLDVSQSRDCYRCAAPAGHFLHFSSQDPHLNDIICRVRNVSLGGLAVDWSLADGVPTFSQGTQTDNAILQCGNSHVHLGKLRVAHITTTRSQCLIGLSFDRGVPKGFDSLVLNVQRTHYL